jgi:hypothetical protein
LILTDCGLPAHGGIAIASSPHLTKLRQLSFSGGSYQANRIGDDGALALTVPTALPGLTNVAVNSCEGITSHGFGAFVESARFATMQQLWAGGCQIADDGIAALARSPHAAALRALNLHGNPITAAGTRALAESPILQLDHLAITLTPEPEGILRPRFGPQLNRSD